MSKFRITSVDKRRFCTAKEQCEALRGTKMWVEGGVGMGAAMTDRNPVAIEGSGALTECYAKLVLKLVFK
jgi:hypothetical protein